MTQQLPPGYRPWGNMLTEDKYRHAHRSNVCDSAELEMSSVPMLGESMNRMWDNHTVEYYVALKTGELELPASVWG